MLSNLEIMKLIMNEKADEYQASRCNSRLIVRAVWQYIKKSSSEDLNYSGLLPMVRTDLSTAWRHLSGLPE